MTNLTEAAECSKCGLLMNDTDEAIAKHRRWHTQWEDAHEVVRRVASNASTDVRNLTATVKDYQRPQPTQAPAAPVSIRVTDDEELEPDESDHIIDINLDDTPDQNEAEHGNVDIPAGYAGRLDEYPLAIDRDDDLDARIANATGTQPTI